MQRPTKTTSSQVAISSLCRSNIATTEDAEAKSRAAREAKRAEYVRDYVSQLFKGISGDWQIKSDSLRQRGGYMGKVNGMAVQVNQQILTSVLACNRFLAKIDRSMYGVGRI